MKRILALIWLLFVSSIPFHAAEENSANPINLAAVTVSAGDFDLKVEVNPKTHLVKKAIVSLIVPGAHADELGLQLGDRLVRISSKPVTDYPLEQVSGLHELLKNGTDLVFIGDRKGRRDNMTITVLYYASPDSKSTSIHVSKSMH